MAKHLLTDVAIRNAKPKAKAYRLADGEGLYLFVPPSGVRSWQFRYRHDGKPQTATLGKLDNLSLQQARARAGEKRRLALDGEHLTTHKRVEMARKAAAVKGTFRALAEAWMKRRARSEKWMPDYRGEVAASLRNHLSALDALPVSSITAQLVTPLLEAAQDRAPDMARKVERRLFSIMNYAMRRGDIAANPVPMPERSKRANARNLPALLNREAVGAVMRAADKAGVGRGVYRAHLLAAFTAQRIGEIVPATWDEFDLVTGTWSIPRGRMKRKEEDRGPHAVPIPPRLLDAIKEWRRMDGEDAEFVCPAPSGNGPITREAVEKFYRRTLGLSGKHSPHSWRTVLSTWANDVGEDADVVEAQLDHLTGGKVKVAYDRAKRIERRADLMARHEGALIAARDGAQIVPLHKAAC
jgi:integrase